MAWTYPAIPLQNDSLPIHASRQVPALATVPVPVPVLATVPVPAPAPVSPKLRRRDLSLGNTRKSELNCQFHADSGLICPLIVSDSVYSIKSYLEQPEHIQRAAVEGLAKEWGSSYTDAYIRQLWQGTDVLYVATTGTAFAACMAVDRKQFYPFISHLYVDPAYRKYGYGTRMLILGEEYARSLGFTEVKLWCVERLVGYYTTRGWTIESEPSKETSGQYVLSKKITAR